MDWLTFVASIVGHVVWPITLIVVVLIFRRSLVKLLPKLRKAKWGDREVEFGEELEEAKAKVASIPEAPPEEQKALPPRPRFSVNPDAMPSLAVLQSWGDIERELKELAVAAETDTERRTTLELIRLLQHESVIDSVTADALNDLRLLRNTAAHSPIRGAISESEAHDYVETAARLADHLRWIRARLNG